MRSLPMLSVPLLAAAAMIANHPVTPTEFSRSTIDLGADVSDIDAAADFYTHVIGFTEIDGFNVAADWATAAGLTDGYPLAVRVFVLEDEDSATRLKLMEVPDPATRKSDNANVHSQLGFRYLTIYVENTNDVLARLRAAGGEPLADGPVLIGDDPSGDYVTVVRDPDGNLLELIGPRR